MKESLDKLKFYDNQFKILGMSFLVLFITEFFFGESDSILLLIPAILILVSIIIINTGMIYHQFKSKKYVWLIITILTFFLGLAPFVLMLFYWFEMRKEFKKGGGVYIKINK